MVVRIPSALRGEIIQYARALDEKHAQKLAAKEPPIAYRTAEDIHIDAPVNVASVPQRSPFRYPGGKTWLIPYIRSWLRSKRTPPDLLIEPFAGGGIVGLTAAFERLCHRTLLVELDDDVAAVWQAILMGQAEWLADRIRTFRVIKSDVVSALGKPVATIRERAFATILKNRVQRGGILASGAGLVKEGENGKGLLSRWYPETLARRIREIAQLRERFLFLKDDAFSVIERFSDIPDLAFFVDPPYTGAARRLYTHWQIDHRRLFALLSRVQGDVLMTYDQTEEIWKLAKDFGFEARPIAMKNTHHAKMTELLIGRDLAWLDRAQGARESKIQRHPELSAVRR